MKARVQHEIGSGVISKLSQTAWNFAQYVNSKLPEGRVRIGRRADS